MKQIENIYDAFINAWKSMAGYINKIGGDALIYAIGLPPAVFVINDIKNILGDKYQPYDIEFFEVDNTFALKYAFHTILVDISMNACIADYDIMLYITNKSNGFMVSVSVRPKDLFRIFNELEKIDLWEPGSDIDAAILKTFESVDGRK